MKSLVLAFALVLLSSTASAQRAFSAAVPDDGSCGKYLENRSKSSTIYDNVYWSWVLGYVTGYNQFSTHPEVEASKRGTTLAYLDKYCRDNPLGLWIQGAALLIGDLGGWKPPR